MAALFRADGAAVTRFVMANLPVIKCLVSRPVVQGSRWDRDMQGAPWGCLLEEMEI